MSLKKKQKPGKSVISGYVEDKVITKIDALAKVNEMSRSEAVEALLEEALEKKKIGKKVKKK